MLLRKSKTTDLFNVILSAVYSYNKNYLHFDKRNCVSIVEFTYNAFDSYAQLVISNEQALLFWNRYFKETDFTRIFKDMKCFNSNVSRLV